MNGKGGRNMEMLLRKASFEEVSGKALSLSICCLPNAKLSWIAKSPLCVIRK